MFTLTAILSAADNGGAYSALLVWLALWAVVGGGIGYAIANGKGRGTAGFWLGFLLGVIGWIIAACLSESDGHRRSRLVEDAYMLRSLDGRYSAKFPAPHPHDRIG